MASFVGVPVVVWVCFVALVVCVFIYFGGWCDDVADRVLKKFRGGDGFDG